MHHEFLIPELHTSTTNITSRLSFVVLSFYLCRQHFHSQHFHYCHCLSTVYNYALHNFVVSALCIADQFFSHVNKNAAVAVKGSRLGPTGVIVLPRGDIGGLRRAVAILQR